MSGSRWSKQRLRIFAAIGVYTLTIIRGESTNGAKSSSSPNVGARPWPARI